MFIVTRASKLQALAFYAGPLCFHPRKFPTRNETAASRSWLTFCLSGLSECRKSCYFHTPDLENIKRSSFKSTHAMSKVGDREQEMCEEGKNVTLPGSRGMKWSS